LFDLKARFFVPTHDLPMASCRDAVKAGRYAAGAACAGVSRPRLDGVEHEADPRMGRAMIPPSPVAWSVSWNRWT